MCHSPGTVIVMTDIIMPSVQLRAVVRVLPWLRRFRAASWRRHFGIAAHWDDRKRLMPSPVAMHDSDIIWQCYVVCACVIYYCCGRTHAAWICSEPPCHIYKQTKAYCVLFILVLLFVIIVTGLADGFLGYLHFSLHFKIIHFCALYRHCIICVNFANHDLFVICKLLQYMWNFSGKFDDLPSTVNSHLCICYKMI